VLVEILYLICAQADLFFSRFSGPSGNVIELICLTVHTIKIAFAAIASQ
jgi:hypothetical protein